jgi:hypothetical protein
MPKFVSIATAAPLIIIVEQTSKKADRMRQFPDSTSGSGKYSKSTRLSINPKLQTKLGPATSFLRVIELFDSL